MTGRAIPREVAQTVWRRLGPRLERIDVRQLVVGDIGLKATALGVAIVLWIAAVFAAAPPEVTLQYGGRVPIDQPSAPPGYVLRADLGDVAVKLRGPEDVVRAIGPQQLHATVDLSKLAPSPDLQNVKVNVTVSDSRVQVAEVTPSSVAIRFERLTQRSFNVQARFANSPPTGYEASPATFRPQEVTVSGPESSVAKVAAVLATVRFGDTAVDLAQDVRPVPVDAAGVPVEDVEVDPVSVRVSVPVVSSATTRTLPLLYQLSGSVAAGYWISQVVTDPATVTVSGERNVVATLDHLNTASVDVGGLTAGRSATVPILVPNGVAIVGSRTAKVTISVVALTGSRPYPQVAVQVLGLGPGLAADLDARTVEVVLDGAVPTLDALGADAVTATVDVTGRGPGTYTIDVTVHAPSGTTVDSVQPARVTVTIRNPRASPSPSPTASGPPGL